MKKVSELGQYISIFLFGYVIFNFVVSITQVIVYGMWGLILDFNGIYIYNLKEWYNVYIIIFIICTIINYIYNFYFINKLNKSLNIVKEK